MAGEDDQAKQEGERLIADARARRQDSDLLVALARLALVRAQGEDHAAAERLLLEAQPVVVARLGENHSRHLTLLNELLGVAFRRGDWPRATGFAQKVHERARAKFGDAHAITYVTLGNWARTLNEAGDPREALDKARTAHAQLAKLTGPKTPQAQDAAFVLALVELQLGHTQRAQALIDQLDVDVLEAGRATGAWPAGVDALRGMALQQRGDDAAARALLDSALQAMRSEEELAHPARVYVLAKAARTRLR